MENFSFLFFYIILVMFMFTSLFLKYLINVPITLIVAQNSFWMCN